MIREFAWVTRKTEKIGSTHWSLWESEAELKIRKNDGYEFVGKENVPEKDESYQKNRYQYSSIVFRLIFPVFGLELFL